MMTQVLGEEGSRSRKAKKKHKKHRKVRKQKRKRRYDSSDDTSSETHKKNKLSSTGAKERQEEVDLEDESVSWYGRILEEERKKPRTGTVHSTREGKKVRSIELCRFLIWPLQYINKGCHTYGHNIMEVTANDNELESLLVSYKRFETKLSILTVEMYKMW